MCHGLEPRASRHPITIFSCCFRPLLFPPSVTVVLFTGASCFCSWCLPAPAAALPAGLLLRPSRPRHISPSPSPLLGRGLK